MTELAEKILARLQEGKRAADIARELGTSKQNVSLVIRQTDYPYAHANELGKRVSKKCANPTCPNQITGISGAVKRRRFCSPSCSLACIPPRVSKETRPCAGCGQPVTRYPSEFRAEITFCSRPCRFTHANPKRKSE